MEIYRTRNQTANVLMGFMTILLFAGWNIYDGLYGDSPIWLLIGYLFALWAAFIGLNLIRRRVYIKISAEKVIINRVVRFPISIEWSQIVSIRLRPGDRVGFISWQKTPNAPFRHTGISQAFIGEEGRSALYAAICRERPDLHLEKH